MGVSRYEKKERKKERERKKLGEWGGVGLRQTCTGIGVERLGIR